MMASEALSRLANPRAILAPPTSDATTHQIVELLLPVVAHEHRSRVQMVDRQVEEALQLVLMEVDRQHAIGSRASETMLAISLALMATRGWSLRSWRAYPK